MIFKNSFIEIDFKIIFWSNVLFILSNYNDKFLVVKSLYLGSFYMIIGEISISH